MCAGVDGFAVVGAGIVARGSAAGVVGLAVLRRDCEAELQLVMQRE